MLPIEFWLDMLLSENLQMSILTYTAACVIYLHQKKAQDVDDAGCQEAAFYHPPMWAK